MRPEVHLITNSAVSHGRTWYDIRGAEPRQLTEEEAAPLDRAALKAGATIQFITRVEASWLPEGMILDHPPCGVSIDSPVFAGDYAFVDTRAVGGMSGNGFLIALHREGREWRAVAHRQSLMVVI